MRAYSLDFRQKALLYIKKGITQEETAKMLQISRKSVSNWVMQYLKTGDLSLKKRKFTPKKIDPKLLVQFMELNKERHLKLADIADHFQCATSSVYKRLNQMGYCYKKKATPMWSLTLKRGACF